jgi:hypothetical protein
MRHYEYAQRRVAFKRPSDFAMSAREFALAKQEMNAALILGEIALEAMARTHAFMSRLAKRCDSLFA